MANYNEKEDIKLAWKEYKNRHNGLKKRIHRQRHNQHSFKHSNKWHEPKREAVLKEKNINSEFAIHMKKPKPGNQKEL